MKRCAVLSVFLIASSALLFQGCLSQMINRSAGSEMVWYCDRCKERVGSKATHVCGLTKFDPATGKDVPMEGVTREEIEMKLKEESAGTPTEGDEEAPPRKTAKRWWQFWR